MKYFDTSLPGDEENDEQEINILAENTDTHSIALLQSMDSNENPLYSTFGTIPNRTVQDHRSSLTDEIANDGPLIIKKTDKDAVKMVSFMKSHKIIVCVSQRPIVEGKKKKDFHSVVFKSFLIYLWLKVKISACIKILKYCVAYVLILMLKMMTLICYSILIYNIRSFDSTMTWSCRNMQMSTATHHQQIMFKIAQTMRLWHFQLQ